MEVLDAFLLGFDMWIRFLSCVVFFTTLLGCQWTRSLRAVRRNVFDVTLTHRDTGISYHPARCQDRTQVYVTNYYR